MRLAEVQVQAARELPAEDGVHHEQRLEIGRPPRGPGQRQGHVRLRRVRTVDEDDARSRELRRLRRRDLRAILARPIAERLLELLEQGALLDIPRDRNDQVVGAQVGAVEIGQIVGRNRLQRRLVPERGQAVRVALGIQVREERPAELRAGRVGLLRHPGQAFAPLDLELAFRERGVLPHVGEHLERLPEARREHLTVEEAAVVARRCAVLDPEPVERVGELLGGAGLRAVQQTRHREGRNAGLRLIGPVFADDLDRHDGQIVTGHQEHADAVLELRLFDLRRHEHGRRARLRRLRAERRVRGRRCRHRLGRLARRRCRGRRHGRRRRRGARQQRGRGEHEQGAAEHTATGRLRGHRGDGHFFCPVHHLEAPPATRRPARGASFTGITMVRMRRSAGSHLTAASATSAARMAS
jgi:hypothetical protein